MAFSGLWKAFMRKRFKAKDPSMRLLGRRWDSLWGSSKGTFFPRWLPSQRWRAPNCKEPSVSVAWSKTLTSSRYCKRVEEGGRTRTRRHELLVYTDVVQLLKLASPTAPPTQPPPKREWTRLDVRRHLASSPCFENAVDKIQGRLGINEFFWSFFVLQNQYIPPGIWLAISTIVIIIYIRSLPVWLAIR